MATATPLRKAPRERTTIFSVRIAVALDERLDGACEKHGVERADLIRTAIAKEVERLERRPATTRAA